LNKKAQLAEFAHNWITGLVVFFIVFIFSMLWYQPFQMIDDKLTPMINNSYQAHGRSVEDLPPQFRRNQTLIPYIFLGGIMVILVLISLKQDPNLPYQ